MGHEALKFASLRRVDVDVVLTGDSISIEGDRGGPVDLRVRLYDGRGLVKLAPARVGDGTVSLHLDFQTTAGEAAAIKLDVDAAGITHYFVPPRLRLLHGGALTAHIDLASQGNSGRALISNLRGRLRMSSKGGRLNLERLLFHIHGLQSTCPAAIDKVDASIDLQVKDGLADIGGVELNAPEFHVAGNGKVDLPDRSVALRLKPQPESCLGAPLLVDGRWNNLLAHPDTR